MFRVPLAVAVCLGLALVTAAEAQTIGTFRWQLQPYCNIVTLTVTQNGPVYEVEGTDDQCGAAQAASASGTAFLNPDGSIGFGLAIVTAPGGTPVHVDASIGLDTLGGAWRDSAGNTGNFVLTPGSGAGGSPRPAPTSNVPQGSVGGAQIDPTQVQARISGACAVGSFMRAVGQDGGASCALETGDLSSLTPGPGLIGGGESGSVSLALRRLPSGAFEFDNISGFAATGGVDGTLMPLSGSGRRLMWYPGKSAFRAGRVDSTQWNDASIGYGSVAMGVNTTASGPESVALGFSTRAAGEDSVAMGLSTTASGAHAFAMGDTVVASGGNSVAMGALSTAAAFESIAMGLRVYAGGNGSVVLGTDAATGVTSPGTFVFADRSTTNQFATNLPNEFAVRAAGGVYLYTNSSLTTGCWLNAGSGAWSCTSDRNTKDHFEPIDGEMVLAKLRAMPIERWSYKSEPSVTHVGPVAQDFHVAFGLGVDDKSIGHLDLSGIALRAIQALETRTHTLNEALARENEALKAALAAVQERLDRLEAKR